MEGDIYSALWFSHTSISDFLNCPRSYFLKHLYRHPKTGRKIKLIEPPLALGQVIHEVVDSLSFLPVSQRFTEPLSQKFSRAWAKVSGKRGGFSSLEVETRYRKRGEEMISRVVNNPGPLANLAVKMKIDLPWFWLDKEESLILCGKIDWLEYLPESDSVHILDFKTSRSEEGSGSLQLPIYYLLASNCQKRPVVKVSYWFLDHADFPSGQPLPDSSEAKDKILKIVKKIKLARQLERFLCPLGSGCRYCRPYESIIGGEGELVGIDDFNQDVYILVRKETKEEKDESVIL